MIYCSLVMLGSSSKAQFLVTHRIMRVNNQLYSVLCFQHFLYIVFCVFTSFRIYRTPICVLHLLRRGRQLLEMKLKIIAQHEGSNP